MAAYAVLLSSVLGLLPSTGAIYSAELFPYQSYRYGRYEANTQFAQADGVVSSFFLWKEYSYLPTVPWNELDFEKVGWDEEDSCKLRLNCITGSPGPEEDPSIIPTKSDICSTFHTYTFEWTSDYIAWFVDGQEVRRETGEGLEAFEENATEGLQLRFNVWPGDETFGGNFTEDDLPVFQYLDWVRYSSWTEEHGFKEEWLQTFNDNKLPEGWVLGNWESPHKHSTHNPGNVVFRDGLAVLQLTPGEPLAAVDIPAAAPRATIPLTLKVFGLSPRRVANSTLLVEQITKVTSQAVAHTATAEAEQAVSPADVVVRVDPSQKQVVIKVKLTPPDGIIAAKLRRRLARIHAALGREVSARLRADPSVLAASHGGAIAVRVQVGEVDAW